MTPSAPPDNMLNTTDTGPQFYATSHHTTSAFMFKVVCAGSNLLSPLYRLDIDGVDAVSMDSVDVPVGI